MTSGVGIDEAAQRECCTHAEAAAEVACERHAHLLPTGLPRFRTVIDHNVARRASRDHLADVLAAGSP
jgi:hypothetical protein